MSNESMTIVSLLVAAVLVLAVLLWIMIRHGRGHRRQDRLERGFERARRVARSGSGVQGTPYSLYAESAWSDDTDERD